MINSDIEFYCKTRNCFIVMPLSECYKVKKKRQNKLFYELRSIDVEGNHLNMNISETAYENLLCRTIGYH